MNITQLFLEIIEKFVQQLRPEMNVQKIPVYVKKDKHPFKR